MNAALSSAPDKPGITQCRGTKGAGPTAFQADDFRTGVHLSICGHAMLEKYLLPYKSMTGKALLLHVDSDFLGTFPRGNVDPYSTEKLPNECLPVNG